jgi:hypothetical protein
MPAPRDVIDLLAAQPDDTLDGMAETLRGTIEQAQAQLALVEAARNRRGRRRPVRLRTGSETGAGSRSHFVKRSELFQIIAEQGRPVQPQEIHAILVDRGYDVSPSAVRTAMGRLVDRDHKLVRLGEGTYAVNYNGSQPAENGSSQPLFAGDEPGSGVDTAVSTPDRGSSEDS